MQRHSLAMRNSSGFNLGYAYPPGLHEDILGVRELKKSLTTAVLQQPFYES
jgi:hypothetical protein